MELTNLVALDPILQAIDEIIVAKKIKKILSIPVSIFATYLVNEEGRYG